MIVKYLDPGRNTVLPKRVAAGALHVAWIPHGSPNPSRLNVTP